MAKTISKNAGKVHLTARELETGKAITGETAERHGDKKVRDTVKKVDAVLNEITTKTAEVIARQAGEIAAIKVEQMGALAQSEKALQKLMEEINKTLLEQAHLHPEELQQTALGVTEAAEEKAAVPTKAVKRAKKAAKRAKKAVTGPELPKLE